MLPGRVGAEGSRAQPKLGLFAVKLTRNAQTTDMVPLALDQFHLDGLPTTRPSGLISLHAVSAGYFPWNIPGGA